MSVPGESLADAWFRATRERFNSSEEDQSLYPIPEKVSHAAKGFYEEQGRILQVVILLSDATAFADNAAEVADAAVNGRPIPKRTNPLERDQPGIFGKRLRRIANVLVQMILSRIIDNFTTYIVEIIADSLRARPEIMRSDEKVSYESVFRAESIEQLRGDLIDRKINELAYLGFAKLVDWIDGKFSIQELQSFPARSMLLSCVQVRNCMVHNRGKANDHYLRHPLPGSTATKVGQPIDLIPDLIFYAAAACSECVAIVDESLSERAKLQRLPIEK